MLSNHMNARGVALHHISHFFSIVSFKTDQLELSSDCNTSVPLPFWFLVSVLFHLRELFLY